MPLPVSNFLLIAAAVVVAAGYAWPVFIPLALGALLELARLYSAGVVEVPASADPDAQALRELEGSR